MRNILTCNALKIVTPPYHYHGFLEREIPRMPKTMNVSTSSCHLDFNSALCILSTGSWSCTLWSKALGTFGSSFSLPFLLDLGEICNTNCLHSRAMEAEYPAFLAAAASHHCKQVQLLPMVGSTFLIWQSHPLLQLYVSVPCKNKTPFGNQLLYEVARNGWQWPSVQGMANCYLQAVGLKGRPQEQEFLNRVESYHLFLSMAPSKCNHFLLSITINNS